jgi:SpoVK/Ycf46/Vps4 family AAA+-type ATPase
MLKQNEALNDMVLGEIAEINTLRSDKKAETTAQTNSEDFEDSEDDHVLDGGKSPKSPIFLVYDNKNKEPGVVEAPPKKETITFKDVGGLDKLKSTIEMKIIKPFQSPEIFAKFHKKSGGGILIYGPPGCGKTFIAKATAGECSAHFRSVRITDILGSYIGESERNMMDIFETARAQKPCVLFFDEVDTLGFSRIKASSSVTRGVVDQLLTEIEGIDTNTDKLLIIGATNMPWDVDEALRRPGRFDRSVFVPPPDNNAREVIFRLKLTGRPVDRIDLRALAEKSPFFSGADIEHAVELAAEHVLEEILRTGDQNLLITQHILVEILSNEKPSTLGWMKTVKDFVKYANQTGFYNEVENYLKTNKL